MAICHQIAAILRHARNRFGPDEPFQQKTTIIGHLRSPSCDKGLCRRAGQIGNGVTVEVDDVFDHGITISNPFPR
jgi:hypothetical protein